MRALCCVSGVLLTLAAVGGVGAAAAMQPGWALTQGSCGCTAPSPFAAPPCMSPTYGYYALGCCPCWTRCGCDHAWDGYCCERQWCRPTCSGPVCGIGGPISAECGPSPSGRRVEPASTDEPAGPAPKPAPRPQHP
jgi:hypothetical protein